ncbi:MAG: arylamine N-acetyltransferase [Methylovulum sp.]|nr:arylamine N-acetyltransferase [Methylovulum sp.]
MKADNFVLQDYFNRIGFQGTAKADIATIAALMRCQLFTVPFENLDVQAGKIVSLVPEAIVEKIVYRQRGGYCYEVNGLFAMALAALGIPYRMVLARPLFYPVRRPKTHMALVLDMADGQWLCDLGFGSYGLRAPIPLSPSNSPVQQEADSFMLATTDGGEYVLKAWVDGAWANQYGFDLSPQEWIDFVPANYLNSTHPEAIFVQKLLVVLHNPAGRHILLGDSLKTVADGRVHTQTLTPDERAAVLAEVFGLPTVL